jgi:hypothetical protein
MTTAKSSGIPILRRQASGFLLIIVVTWLAEIFHVPHYLFGGTPEFNWPRVLLRTIVVVAVWGWVYWSTRRLLQRLHRLEKFLLVCSWCRKVGDQGSWMTLEEYFGQKFDTQTSHGICPECMQSARANHHKLTCVSVAEPTSQPTL